MEENIIKIPCVCCLGNNLYSRNINVEYVWHGETEVYEDMLEKCFGIRLNLTEKFVDPQICESCIKKLRHCLKFKENILKIHKEIYEYFNGGKTCSEPDEIGIEYSENDIKEEIESNTESPGDEDHGNDFDCAFDMEEKIQNDEINFFIDEKTGLLRNKDEVDDIEFLEEEILLEGDAAAPSKRKSAANPPKPQHGSSKRRDYLEEQLQDCMQAIKEGLMSQNQAAIFYNVPRQTVQVRLKKELGDQYDEVVNRWRKNLVSISKKREDAIKERELQLKKNMCLKKIKSGSMSVMAATKKYKISSAVIKKALQEEYGDRYMEAVLTLRRQYYKVRRDRGEVYNRESHLRNSGRKKPDKDTLIRAVTAIKDKKMTLAGAANYFAISSKLLDRLILNEVDVENTELKDLLKPPRVLRNYSQERLDECLQSVRTGKLKQKVAAKVYNISQQTIYKKLREEFEEKSKNFENEEKTKVVEEIIKNNVVTSAEEVPVAEVQVVIEEIDETVSEELIKSVKSIITHTNVTPFKLNKGYYACVCCDVDTNNIEILREHYQTHSDQTDSFIDTFFQTKPQTDVIRLDIVNLTCKICSEKIKRWSYLAQHLQSHDLSLDKGCWYSIIPYVVYMDYVCCALCNMRFEMIVQLDEHLSKHYKNHECGECGEGFVTGKWLLYHQHVKSLAGRACDCELCAEIGRRVDGLSDGTADIVEERRLVHCHHCADGFNDYYARYLHMLQYHRHKLKQYTCEHCGKNFNWKPFYSAHLKDHGLQDD